MARRPRRADPRRSGHDAPNERYFHENPLINDLEERGDIESLAGERQGLKESVMGAGVAV
jgi:hypothetical protein